MINRDEPFNLEIDLDKHVCKWLRSGGLKFLKQGRASNPGYPDLLIFLGCGRHVWVELKAKNGTLTEQQKITISKLRGNFDRVAVCRTVQEVIDFVTESVNYYAD